MKKFTGLKINGTYELVGDGLEVKTDTQVSNVTPVELLVILSTLVSNVLDGADKENANLFKSMFVTVFKKFVEEAIEDANDDGRE